MVGGGTCECDNADAAVIRGGFESRFLEIVKSRNCGIVGGALRHASPRGCAVAYGSLGRMVFEPSRFWRTFGGDAVLGVLISGVEGGGRRVCS